MSVCSRCAECSKYSHHWIPNSRFGDGTPWGEAEMICKHCIVLGDECRSCYGHGTQAGDGEEAFCDVCNGEGVIERG